MIKNNRDTRGNKQFVRVHKLLTERFVHDYLLTVRTFHAVSCKILLLSIRSILNITGGLCAQARTTISRSNRAR